MRIAAGVLLIIVGIVNGIAGAGYATMGAGGELAKQALAEAAKNQDTSKMTPEAKAQMEKAQADIKKATEDAPSTGGLAFFGIFLIVMLALQIAGAVTLFMQKAAKFIMVVAILGLVAELGGVLAFGMPFGITNILGIVASVLAFLAARGIAAGPAAA